MNQVWRELRVNWIRSAISSVVALVAFGFIAVNIPRGGVIDQLSIVAFLLGILPISVAVMFWMMIYHTIRKDTNGS